MTVVFSRFVRCAFFGWGIIIISLPTGYAQSPWTRSRAGFYVQAAWQTIPPYTSLYSESGKTRPLDRRLTENAFQLYGEYGLRRYTTLVVSLPFRFQRAGRFLGNTSQPLTSAGTLSGLGNASLAIRQSLLRGRWPLTGTIRVDVPVNNYNENAGLRTGYHAFTFHSLLSTGRSFPRFYWFVYAGAASRTKGYGPYANAGAETGYRFGKLWTIAFTEVVSPAPDNSQPELSVQNQRTGLYVDDQGYWSLGLKGLYQVRRFWGLTASAAGAGWGRAVPRQPALSLGACFRWD